MSKPESSGWGAVLVAVVCGCAACGTSGGSGTSAAGGKATGGTGIGYAAFRVANSVGTIIVH